MSDLEPEEFDEIDKAYAREQLPESLCPLRYVVPLY
jgi:hypothetical protein